MTDARPGGGAGTIGRRAGTRAASRGCDVVVAGRTSGDVHVDLASHDSFWVLYREVTSTDAVVGIAALELPHGMRVNVVSPSVMGDSADAFAGYFPGMRPVPMDELVGHYRQRVEGESFGQIIRAYG
jgi:hypothetical protein